MTGNKKDCLEIFLVPTQRDDIASLLHFYGPKHKNESVLPVQNCTYYLVLLLLCDEIKISLV